MAGWYADAIMNSDSCHMLWGRVRDPVWLRALGMCIAVYPALQALKASSEGLEGCLATSSKEEEGGEHWVSLTRRWRPLLAGVLNKNFLVRRSF